MTCSVACRKRLSRHRELYVGPYEWVIKRFGSDGDITIPLVLRMQAVKILRPDLGEKLATGELELEDIEPVVNRAFSELVSQELVKMDQTPDRSRSRRTP